MNKRLVGAALGVAALVASATASAHVDVGIGVGIPGPVYVAPPPVYVQPPPVVYAAPPVVAYGEDDDWRAREWREHREWRERQWRRHVRDESTKQNCTGRRNVDVANRRNGERSRLS